MNKITVNIFWTLIISFFVQGQNSNNMGLMSSLYYPQGLNDVWGYSDGDHEYALVGTQTGLSVVDVTNPYNPTELFFINGTQSIWRDIKTWQNYAYVSVEESDGLLIVDLSDLTGSTYIYIDTFFTEIHNLFIDENGFLYAFGGTPSSGVIILDLNGDPMNPTLAGAYNDYYLHDGMVRGDTLWGAAMYEGLFTVIDVSDKANIQTLSSYPTPCSFTHNVWVSDDNNYVFTTDEQSACFVAAYDVTDIYNITQTDLIQDWSLTGDVVPHNTHVLGDYLITSYYTSGVNIIDASNPFDLVEVGYYDTSPLSGSVMDGCWGTYPYLPSGIILATDQQEGLFVLCQSVFGDSDGDLVIGSCDNCSDTYNPDQLDTDADGLGDACDPTPMKLESSLLNKTPIHTTSILGQSQKSQNMTLTIYDDGSVEKNYYIK